MSTEKQAFDTTRKFVRVVELRKDGLVEFQFAIGEPEMFVELMLPAAAFDDFCAVNKVTFLDEKSQLKVGDEEPSDWEWSLRDVSQKRFR